VTLVKTGRKFLTLVAVREKEQKPVLEMFHFQPHANPDTLSISKSSYKDLVKQLKPSFKDHEKNLHIYLNVNIQVLNLATWQTSVAKLKIRNYHETNRFLEISVSNSMTSPVESDGQIPDVFLTQNFDNWFRHSSWEPVDTNAAELFPDS